MTFAIFLLWVTRRKNSPPSSSAVVPPISTLPCPGTPDEASDSRQPGPQAFHSRFGKGSGTTLPTKRPQPPLSGTGVQSCLSVRKVPSSKSIP